MACIYGGKALIPAPFVSISKEYQTTEDGMHVGSVYLIVLTGKLVSWRGSPNSSGVFYTGSGYPPDEVPQDPDSRLTAMLAKQYALRKLFSVEGQTLEIQPYDGSPPTKCNPRVRKIDFPSEQWYEVCDYSITLEADVIFLNGVPIEESEFGSYNISRASEEWNLEIIDEAKLTYRLSRALSAVGKRLYDDTGNLTQPAWENARDYVLAAHPAFGGIGLGLKSDRMTAPGVLDDSLQAYNYVRVQHVGELSGTFSVSETWFCYDPQGQPPAVEDWNVSIREQTGKPITVTVAGTITGLAIYDNTAHTLVSSRWDNAKNKWLNYIQPNMFSRAETVSGITLNPTALSYNYGYNEVNGVVTYSYDYDERATTLISGAITESFTIIDIHAADVFARIPVLGRPVGPVLQSIQTITEKKRTISLEAQMKAKTITYTPTQPTTDSIVLSYKPAATVAIFLEQDEESWSANTGRYTRQTAYVWE